MKAFNVRRAALAAVAALFAVVLALCWFAPFDAYASSHSESEDDDSYSYVIDIFNAVYDVDDSGCIEVTEVFTVTYTGAKSYAVTRTLAADNDDRVRNLEVYELEGSVYEEAEYTLDSESETLIIEIGDEDSKTNETHVYKLTYVYFNAQQAESSLSLYPFNGIEAEITLAQITVNLPCEYNCTYSLDDVQTGECSSGPAVITLTEVSSGASLYVNVTYSAGAVAVYSDMSGYYALIALGVIAVALLLVKLLAFNKYRLNKELRKEPPFGYDPLIVGKLIDNNVSDSDVTSLIYHWAVKGYIRVNIKDPNKPVITKISNLPAIAPDYQQILFYKLFKNTNVVYIDELDEDFYKTTETVKKAVDRQAHGSYSNVSMGLSVLFAILAAFVIGGAPTLYAVFGISHHYIYITGLIFALPALVIYGLCESLMYNRYKLKAKQFWGYAVGLIALCAVMTVIYVFVVPSNLIEMVPKILINVLGYAVIICSTLLISRTEKYNGQLGAILGFRKYIITAGHAELREAAAKDPQLFYEIYPYAQVLNLEKEWTDKFYSMNVKPPVNIESSGIGEVSAEIVAAMRTARIRIGAAISTPPAKAKKKAPQSDTEILI